MSEFKRTFVIINNAAARARLAWPSIESALVRSRIDFDAHETSRAGDATEATRAALRAGYELIAVVGGDGTLSEAAEGFFERHEAVEDSTRRRHADDANDFSSPVDLPNAINREAALAILPAGTGDDFARGLLGRRAPVEEWTRNLIASCRRDEGKGTRTVDVIRGRSRGGVGGITRSFICLNVATLGLGAEVAARVSAQSGPTRRLPGEARFVSAALGALLAWRERPVRVSLDGGTPIDGPMNLLAIANGIYAGGGMMFAPEASLDDGMMNIMLASGLTRAAILRELPRIRRGGHLANPKVRAMKATRILVETLKPEDALPVEADGNIRGSTPAEFRIMPRALKVVLPE